MTTDLKSCPICEGMCCDRADDAIGLLSRVHEFVSADVFDELQGIQLKDDIEAFLSCSPSPKTEDG